MNPSVKQALHFFTLIDQKGTPEDQLQALYRSGLLADLLDANVDKIDRETFRKVCGLGPLVPVFPVWKTIKLGLHKTPKAYEQVLESAGFKINDFARRIIQNITVSQTEVELDLVVVTLAMLGLERATYQQICDRAKELGLELCPREVGPALRLAYPDQPYGEWLRVAMPVTGSDGDLDVFYVGHVSDGQWLNAYWFNPQDVWHGDGRFVFVRSRK